MLEKDLSVLDIKANFNNYDKLWSNCMSYIKENCHSDPLYENYLSIVLENFQQFSVAIYDNEIISFGGLEQRSDRWGNNIFRALTRFWIHPKYRSKGLTKWSSDKIRFSPIILKSQLEDCQDDIAVMITREGNYLRSFAEIVRLANSISEKKFTILDGKFNVCNPEFTSSESCKQYVAITDVKIFYQAQRQGFFPRYE